MLTVDTLDAGMLMAETPEMPMHTLGILLLDAPEGDAYEAMRRMFEARLAGIAPFRRRLMPDPRELDDLKWIEDPGFDLDRHLLRETLPKPGDHEALATLVGRYAAVLLPRDKPLWEVTLVEGLASGQIAVAAKIHHAAMDGGRLVALLGHLFDRSPDATPEPPANDDWQPDALPGTLWLAADTIRTLAGKPGRVAHALVDIVKTLRRSKQAQAAAGARPGAKGESFGGDGGVPWTPFTGALSDKRSVAFSDVSMEDLRTIRAAFGTTINDVVLAASCGALRSWLLRHDALPDRPLVANVPIAIRAAEGDEEAGNRVSMLRVHLPVGVDAPAERLRLIHAETSREKRAHRSSGGNVYQQVADLVLNITVPWVVTHVVGAYSKSSAADLHPALWNLVISNVPGPDHDLYCGGAKVTHIYPFGPVQHGSGLNLTVLSTTERMCLGALACSERVPDVQAIAEDFVFEVEALKQHAGG